MSSQLHDVIVRIGAGHDAVDIAREDLRGVGDGLAPAELNVATRQEETLAAELEHPHLEAHTSPSRGLLEDHRQALALESTRMALRICFDSGGEIEQTCSLVGGEIVGRQEALYTHSQALPSVPFRPQMLAEPGALVLLDFQPRWFRRHRRIPCTNATPLPRWRDCFRPNTATACGDSSGLLWPIASDSWACRSPRNRFPGCGRWLQTWISSG